MTGKVDFENFDPNEWTWDATQLITRDEAACLMLRCELAYHPSCRSFYRYHPGGAFEYFNVPEKSWKPAHMNGGTNDRQWCRAIRKRKPEPVNPAEATAGDILNALRDGKLVVDADGVEVDLFWKDAGGVWSRNVRFPLRIKEEPKPRRVYTLPEALKWMAENPGREMVSNKLDTHYRWNSNLSVGRLEFLLNDRWVESTGTSATEFYETEGEEK